MIQAAAVGCEPNLAQHFMASQITAEIAERMVERFAVLPELVGRVVIGAAISDMHGLG